MKRTLLALGIVSSLAASSVVMAQGERKERREERRDDRKDAKEKRQDRREDRRDNRKEKREEMREKREDRRDDRKDRREDMREKREDRRDDRKDARKDRRDNRKERQDAIRNRWKERRQKVLVTGYSPVDKKVIVRGSNFPKDAVVWVGGKPVKATISPTRIHFDAGISGRIVVKAGGAEYYVGNYEKKDIVTKKVYKARQSEWEKRARERVKGRWVKRAKTRADRQAAYEKELAEREATRQERARERARAMRAKFEREFLASEPVQTELALHAARRARLLRMQRLADIDDREKLAIRIDVLIEREDDRHQRRIAVLRANFKG